jgi:hypothetical protein
MRTGAHQVINQVSACIQQVLAVVEDEQQMTVPENRCQRASHRLVGTLAHAHGGRHEMWHQARIGDGPQFDEPDAVGVALESCPSHFQRQPCLAAPANPRQGQ